MQGAQRYACVLTICAAVTTALLRKLATIALQLLYAAGTVLSDECWRSNPDEAVAGHQLLVSKLQFISNLLSCLSRRHQGASGDHQAPSLLKSHASL
jgi:hypothetical protein